MVRIIFGILILLGLLGSVADPNPPTFGSHSEMMGFATAQIALLILSIWLIHSGIRKRQLKKGKKIEEAEIGIIPLAKEYFTSYKGFLTKYIGTGKPPYWFLVFWAYGLSKALVRFDALLIGATANYSINTWLGFWLISLVWGIVIALIGYWVVGSIFHLGVLLAGGKGKAKTSRLIYLYSSMPHVLAAIVLIALNMLVMGKNYFEYGGLAIEWLLVLFIAATYSWYLAYAGAVKIQKTKKFRSILIFLILPILLQSSVFLYSYLA